MLRGISFSNVCFFSFLFSIVVNPTKLSEGLHYYEVYGVDCKAPWRGPIFRIPVTITKPMTVKNHPPFISFSRMSFLPGHFCPILYMMI
jgi:tripeptidyl-peptidase-2